MLLAPIDGLVSTVASLSPSLGGRRPPPAALLACGVGILIQVDRFADGEVNVMVKENVRGKDVYIIQPTCMPVNENLVELLLMVRADGGVAIRAVDRGGVVFSGCRGFHRCDPRRSTSRRWRIRFRGSLVACPSPWPVFRC